MKNIKIGRDSDNQIILPPDDRLSRHHAALDIAKDGSMILRDFSLNGTMVNGVKIHNASMPIQRGANVLFAGVARLNWSEVPEEKPPGTFKKWYVLLPVVALLTGLLLWIFWDKIFPPSLPPTPVPASTLPTAEQIDKKFKNSVGMIVHAYYLKKEIKGSSKPLFIGYSKAIRKHLDKYYLAVDDDRENLMPFIEMGTGFLIAAEDGNIVTNRHVANIGWNVNKDRDKMDEERKEFIDTIDNRIYRYLNGKSTIDKSSFLVHTTKMKFLPSGVNVNIQKDITDEEFLESIQNVGYDVSRVREHGNPEIDLALLRTMIPVDTGHYHLINNSEIEWESDSINTGGAAYLIGFSGGLMNSYTRYKDEIRRIFQPGSFSSEPDKYNVQYSMNGIQKGSSGSPVFNAKGKVIAINYRGLQNVSGEGILARYLRTLTSGYGTEDDNN